MAGTDLSTAAPKRILLLGASGTIGEATARALLKRGHEVVCFVRARSPTRTISTAEYLAARLTGATIRTGDVTNRVSLAHDGFRGEQFDAIVSCLASRTGERKDAQRIDYQANLDALQLGKALGVTHMVLLSAICVQRPKLAFQRAKLAFESALIASGVDYTIIRPTAFFKSLTGQVERLKAGKTFLIFGNGELTACKPISDHDLADFIAGSLEDETRRNRILPIGGPGEAITPRAQGEYMFSLLGQKPRFRSVPPGMLLAVANPLGVAARLIPPLAAKAEYARIGHYYATESMLLIDPETGEYNADLTPAYGSETLYQHLEKLMRSDADSVKQ